MRICFTSDIHGDRSLYDQLTDLLRTETPDLLILGGDLVRDVKLDAPAGPQLARLEREFMERVAAWRSGLPRLTVACIMGNHELAPFQDASRRHHDAGRIVLLDHRQAWHYGGFAWLGYGCSPPSPHWAKDLERLDLPEDSIPAFPGVAWDPAEQRLQYVDLAAHFGGRAAMSQELAEISTPDGPWILVAHAPPHETNLDRLPNVPYPIGSRAVRRFIEERQPALALHGHVHESPLLTGSFTDRLGTTLCVNPGQGRERLQAVLFDLDQPAHTLRHTVFA